MSAAGDHRSAATVQAQAAAALAGELPLQAAVLAVNAASSLIDAEAFGEAIQQLEQSLVWLVAEPNDEVAASAHFNLGIARRESGQLPDAEASFTLAADLRFRGDDAAGEARARYQLGSLARERSSLAEARTSLARATDLAWQGQDFELAADAARMLAWVHGDLGDPAAAEAAFNREAAAEHALGNGRLEVQALLRRAALAAEGRGGLAAEPLYAAAAKRAAEIDNPQAIADCEHGLGVNARRLGRIRDAFSHYQRALELRPNDAPERAESLGNLAQLLRDLGQDEVAVTYQREAVAAAADAAPLTAAIARVNLATSLDDLGEHRKALQLYERAISELEAVGDVRHRSHALHALGACLGELGEQRRAIAAVRRALALRVAAADRTGVATSLSMLAELLLHTGLPVQAERIARRAITAARDASEARVLAEALHLHGEALRALGRPEEALGPLRAAVASTEETLARIGGDEARAGFWGDHAYMAADLAACLVQLGRCDDAVSELETRRARGVRSLRSAPRSPDAALRDLPRDDLDAAHLQRQLIAASLHEIPARVGTWDSAVADAIRSRLGARTAWLGYASTRTATLLFVIGRDRPVRCLRLAPASAWSEQAATARAALVHLWPEPPDTAPLYQQLLAPAEELLTGTDTLLIAADRPLHGLPFAALERPDGTRLLDTHVLQMTPSPLLTAAPARAPKTAWTGLAGPADGGRGRSAPAVEREVVEIAALLESHAFEPVQAITGEAATRERLAHAVADGSRWLHLAAHADAEARVPSLAHLRLADGILTARDIASLNLSRTDLVVLSCCDTGTGRVVPGEGTLGLARAVLAAGAARVCASLWQVPDTPTRELMSRFYPALIERGDPAAALAAAQRSLSRDEAFAHPGLWAGFTIYATT